MSSIIENKERIGAFTSSEAYKLMTNGNGPGKIGAPAVTYIAEKNIELKLGRSIKTDAYSKDLAWGTLLQTRVYDLLPFGYELVPDVTDLHPLFKYWAGSKDLIRPGLNIGEIKCYQPKNFAIFTDALMTKNIDVIRKTCDSEYWQAVSNAIINHALGNIKTCRAALISYMPYKSELPEIRELAENYDGFDQWKYRFIAEGEESTLAFLPDGGYYSNLNIFEFEVPEVDIEAMHDRMQFCSTLLIYSQASQPETKTQKKEIFPGANDLKI